MEVQTIMVKGPRKYIVIPEYRPLYAMQECYGPTHGPLKQPCLTPLAVIRKLLLQTGNESLTVMEVIKDEKTGKYSKPVRLTLDNYMLPYDEIKNGKKVPTSEARVIMSKDRPIQPKKAKFNPNPDDSGFRSGNLFAVLDFVVRQHVVVQGQTHRFA